MRNVFELFDRMHRLLFQDLWQWEPKQMGPIAGRVVRLARFIFVLLRELLGGELNLHAMSLVYTTLLSLVPLLAVSFSVLKAFGVHNQIEPFLLSFTEPLGPKGVEVTERIVMFVENVKVGVLGSVGLLFLIYTVVTLIQKVESSFNFVWRIHRARSISRRFSDYLSVILIGPVLVFSAMGITASITNNAIVQRLLEVEPFGTLVVYLGQVVPYLFVIAAFIFVYIFVPNTRVHFRSALVGGAVGGVLWQTTGVAFASFAAGSTRYDALYSGFAIIIIFMIWLYLSWLILLMGAQIAYYHQHPQQIRVMGGRFRPSCRLKEEAGLTIVYLVVENYIGNRCPWSLDGLVQRLKLPGDAVEDLVLVLCRRGLLAETGDDPAYFLPARDPDRLTVAEVIQVLRGAEEDEYTAESAYLDVAVVNEVLHEAARKARTVMGRTTLRALVERDQRRRAESPPQG